VIPVSTATSFVKTVFSRVRAPACWVANQFGGRYRIEHNLTRFDRIAKQPQPAVLPVEEAIERLRKDLSNKTCFVGRWGTTEYDVLFGALGMRKWFERRFNESDYACMSINSGFFPRGCERLLERFARTYCEASQACTHHRLLGDYKGSALCPGEAFVAKSINPDVTLIPCDTLEILREPNAWLHAVSDKRVLIISPFVEDMKAQFPNLRKVWRDNLSVPVFHPVWYEAIQSRGNSPATREFDNWFEALGYMKGQIARLDFDIALISCGAYGMPLGSFIFKSLHRTAIYFGGELQLFFGLIGPRWETDKVLRKLLNKHWSTPTHNTGDQEMLGRGSRYTHAD